MFSIKSLLLIPDQGHRKSRPSVLNISSLLSPEPEFCSYDKDINYFERQQHQQHQQEEETDLLNESIWHYKYRPNPYHQHHHHQHHHQHYNTTIKQNESYRKGSISSINSYSIYSSPSSKCGSSSSSSSSSSGEEQQQQQQQQYRSARKLHKPLKFKRRRTSSQQLTALNSVFERTFFPSTQVRMELACQLSMSPRTVQIWFQNKRQAVKTKP